MPRLLKHFTEPPRDCVYLPGQSAQLETRVMLDVSAEQFGDMLSRGWRRFGPFYFRPACQACQACLSIRIPVEHFVPSTTQRRTLRRLEHITVEIAPPRVDEARLALYHQWHGFREELRGWTESKLDRESYQIEFAFPHPAAREITYYDRDAPGGPRLIGVGLCDETPAGWSAIYFYYDPAYARWSPGVLNVLFQIEHARALGLPYVYLGYYVEGCASMRYKANFRPHEILQGRPDPREPPRWSPPVGVGSPLIFQSPTGPDLRGGAPCACTMISWPSCLTWMVSSKTPATTPRETPSSTRSRCSAWRSARPGTRCCWRRRCSMMSARPTRGRTTTRWARISSTGSSAPGSCGSCATTWICYETHDGRATGGRSWAPSSSFDAGTSVAASATPASSPLKKPSRTS